LGGRAPERGRSGAAFYQTGETAPQVTGMAKALEGLRVLECGRMAAAAYAAKLLADLGATVIKVEEPQGDIARRYGPFPGGEPHPEKSALFLYLNCNKKGITLDLRQPEGQALLQRLVAWADVLVHNYPPPEMAARGLDYEALARANPRLVMASISPFGHEGPHRDYRGYDINVMAAGGWAWLNGWPGHPEEPPLKAYGPQTEYQAGIAAAVALLGALLHREETGQGQHIEVSGQEVVATELEFVFPFWPYERRVPVRWGQRIIAPWDYFRCQDGWAFVICVEEHQWERLVELMGDPEWAHWEIFSDRTRRAQNYDVLRPLLEEWFAQWRVDDLYKAAQAKRIPLAPAYDAAGLLESQHLREREFFVSLDHPVAGTYRYPGSPYHGFSETPAEVREPAPTLGQHNQEVYGGILGLSQEEIAALRQRAVI